MRLMVEKLACVRGGRTLYDGLSFSLMPGDAILVSGPNGAGKTSLLRQIAGLLPLDEGTVAADEGGLSERTHFLGHADALKPSLSVEENLAFWREIYGGPNAALEAALKRLDLHSLAPLPARVLSAGQRRRLALARLLAAPRPLWLLDEPDAALDRQGRETLAAMIEEHRGQGGIAMVASHSAPDFSPTRELVLGASAKIAA